MCHLCSQEKKKKKKVSCSHYKEVKIGSEAIVLMKIPR